MTSKILITGPPRCGKSTLMLRILNYYKGKRTIYGFLTPEVKRNNQRIGFDIEDIRIRQRFELARKDKSYKGRYRIGKYRVFTKNLDNYIETYQKLELSPQHLIIVDEIGKMELYSENFQDFVKNIFSLDVNVMATIGKTLRHPLKDKILKITRLELHNLTRQNQELIFQKLSRECKVS